MPDITVYQIDSGVPVPEGSRVPIPLSKLEIGESILFPLQKRASVQSQASAVGRRTGKVFTVRKQGEKTARVWRKS